MKKRGMPIAPPPEVMKHIAENYRYDPETGEFWRRAGMRSGWGYQCIAGTIGSGKSKLRWDAKSHRVAFFLMTGEWLPDNVFVDHINGDRADNRWENLRLCSAADNARNRKPWGKVKSRGVSLIQSGKRLLYRATIGTYPNVKRLGDFMTETEAANAYDAEASARYGEFARLNGSKGE